MYVDSHAHYDDESFNEDRFELINEMHENGVSLVVNAGADIKSSLASIELAKRFSFFYAAVGVHPHETENMTESDVEVLRKCCKYEKVVAIGEIGLDYYYDGAFKDIQKKWFRRQLELAKELDLPVVIHSREASKDCFDIIKESGVRKGVIHSFSGSSETALDYIDMGFYIGVGGIVTFNNAKKLVKVVEDIPLERILTETDSPYLSPVPNRGKRNNSQNIKYIVEKIAQIKQINHEIVAEKAMQNLRELFAIK